LLMPWKHCWSPTEVVGSCSDVEARVEQKVAKSNNVLGRLICCVAAKVDVLT
jgi:hypothetical protein